MYVPPFRRSRAPNPPNLLVDLIGEELLIDGNKGIYVLPEENLDSSTSYSYSQWMVINSRSSGWCSIIHRGYTEFHRCPGLWLCPDSNHLHLRVSSSQDVNFGKSKSNRSLDIGVPAHITIVVNGSTKQIQLYIDGVLDFEKSLPGKTDEFLPGRGPLYFGRDMWHAPSNMLISKFRYMNKSITSHEVRDLYESQRQDIFERHEALLSQRSDDDDDAINSCLHDEDLMQSTSIDVKETTVIKSRQDDVQSPVVCNIEETPGTHSKVLTEELIQSPAVHAERTTCVSVMRSVHHVGRRNTTFHSEDYDFHAVKGSAITLRVEGGRVLYAHRETRFITSLSQDGQEEERVIAAWGVRPRHDIVELLPLLIVLEARRQNT
jgi:hypothetical protein